LLRRFPDVAQASSLLHRQSGDAPNGPAIRRAYILRLDSERPELNDRRERECSCERQRAARQRTQPRALRRRFLGGRRSVGANTRLRFAFFARLAASVKSAPSAVKMDRGGESPGKESPRAKSRSREAERTVHRGWRGSHGWKLRLLGRASRKGPKPVVESATSLEGDAPAGSGRRERERVVPKWRALLRQSLWASRSNPEPFYRRQRRTLCFRFRVFRVFRGQT